MKIARIAVYRDDLPRHEGIYSGPGGRSVSVFHGTIVELERRAGVTGFGEVGSSLPPLPGRP